MHNRNTKTLQNYVLIIVYLSCSGCGSKNSQEQEVLQPVQIASRGGKVERVIFCREKPLSIHAIETDDSIISDSNLTYVLVNALPVWHPETIPTLYHSLRLWGLNASFSAEMIGHKWEARAHIQTILSDRVCKAQTSTSDQRPGEYIISSPYGLHFVQTTSADAVDFRAEPHFGKAMQVAGELGLESSTVVIPSEGSPGTLQDVYQDTLMHFSWSSELEFVAVALAHWHPPEREWKDRFGNVYDFDQLAAKLMAKPYGEGACGGCHVPYAMACILFANEKTSIVSASTKSAMEGWFLKISRHLEERHRSQGHWEKNWHGRDMHLSLWNHDLLNRITIIGHHLEWIALVPTRLRPSKAVLTSVIHDLCMDIANLPPQTSRSFKSVLPVSHAARAVCLLRGVDPYTFIMARWKAGQLRIQKDKTIINSR